MTWIVVGAVVVFAVFGAVPFYLDWKRARLASLPREVPPLVFSMPGPEWKEELRGLRPIAVERQVSSEPVAARFAPPVSQPVHEPVASRPSPSSSEMEATSPQSSANDTVHFRRPSDEALQLLPGRLEVLSGISGPREIRFVRIPGERPQVILGREPGRSPPHVALPSGTVSRQHARLDFAGGGWGLTNLSRTNPVVVNDERMSSGQGERVLVDGDRIELGDVVLRFSAH